MVCEEGLNISVCPVVGDAVFEDYVAYRRRVVMGGVGWGDLHYGAPCGYSVRGNLNPLTYQRVESTRAFGRGWDGSEVGCPI